MVTIIIYYWKFVIDKVFVFNLKLPCRNRGCVLIDNNDGTVTIDGNLFRTMQECEDYLETISSNSQVNSRKHDNVN